MHKRKAGCIIVIALCLMYNQALQQITGPRIMEHPKNTYVVRDDLPVLNCSVESTPPAVITWYKDGHLVTTSAEDNSSNRMILPGGRLFFLKFILSSKGSIKSDVGLYYCNATNPETKVSVISRPARLDVAVIRDEFREHPQSTDATPGQDVLLTCRPPRGDPEPKVKWVKDAEHVIGQSDRMLMEDNNLKILRVRKEDVGSYACLAYNLAGERSSNAAQLVLREKPAIIRGPDDAVVDEETDIMLRCDVIGDPEPSVTWKKRDGEVPSFRSNVLEDNSLTIQNVRMIDAGVYVCRVENSFGWQEVEARLTVYYKPRFSVVPKNKIALKNRKIMLDCLIIGNPQPVVYWTRLNDNVQIFPNQVVERMYLTEGGTLYIAPTQIEDSGEYICSGVSQSGNTSAKVRLDIKDVSPGHPPIIGLGPQSQILPEGSWAVLHCEAYSDKHSIGISWLKDNSVLSLHNSRLTIIEGGSLQISGLTYEDAGTYTCKAVSESGETTWSSNLRVEPTSSHVVFYRTPGKGNFPGPPTELIVTEVTESGVRLSWQRNSSASTSYTQSFVVEYFNVEDGDGWEIASDKVEDTTELVQNLRPSTTYLFFVRARNAFGLSYPCPVSHPIKTKGDHITPLLPVVTTSLGSIPDKVVLERIGASPIVHLLSAEVLSTHLVKITWEVRKNQKYVEGFRIAYHKVEPDENFDELSSSTSFSLPPPVFEEVVSNPAATMHVLSNMEKFTTYDVTVRPFFRTVRGSESNVIRIKTMEDVPSSPPEKIEAYYLDNNTLQVAWEGPKQDQIHGVLLGYKIYILGEDNQKGKELQTNATTTSIIIKPTPREHLKKIQMSAITRAGEGVRSQVVHIDNLNQPNSEQLEKKNSSGGRLLLEPWFIGVVVSVVGAVLWVSLCIFTLYVYKRKRGSKKNMQGAQPMTCKVSTAISNKTHQIPLLGNNATGNGNCYHDSGCYDTKMPGDQENQLFGHTYQTLESLQDQQTNQHDTTFADSGFCSSGLLLPQQSSDHVQQQVVRSNQAPGQSSSTISGGKPQSCLLPNIPNPAAYMIRHGSNSTTMSSNKSQANKQHPSFPGTGTGISNNSRPQEMSDGMTSHQYVQQNQQQFNPQQQQQQQQQLFKASMEQLPASNFYPHLQLKKLPMDPLSDVNTGTYHSGGGVGGINHYQENVWYPDLPPGNSQIENLLQYGILSDSTSPQSCVDCKNSTSYDSPCVGNLDSSFESRPSQDFNRRTNHPLPDPKSIKYDLYQTGQYNDHHHNKVSSPYCNDVNIPLMSKSHLGKTREWTTIDYMDHNQDISEMYPLEKVLRSGPQATRTMTDSVFNPNGGDVYNQKNKKSKSARQRAHRSASPCSTDSSYGGTNHVAKPKSQRKKQQSMNKLDHNEFNSAFKPIRDDIIIGKSGHYSSHNNNNNNNNTVSTSNDSVKVISTRRHNSTFDISDDSEDMRRADVVSAFEMTNTPIV